MNSDGNHFMSFKALVSSEKASVRRGLAGLFGGEKKARYLFASSRRHR